MLSTFAGADGQTAGRIPPGSGRGTAHRSKENWNGLQTGRAENPAQGRGASSFPGAGPVTLPSPSHVVGLPRFLGQFLHSAQCRMPFPISSRASSLLPPVQGPGRPVRGPPRWDWSTGIPKHFDFSASCLPDTTGLLQAAELIWGGHPNSTCPFCGLPAPCYAEPRVVSDLWKEESHQRGKKTWATPAGPGSHWLGRDAGSVLGGPNFPLCLTLM